MVTKEKMHEYNHRYWITHREQEKARKHKYESTHREERQEAAKLWNMLHPGYATDQSRRAREKVRERLGGKCQRCGNPDPRVLQVDHVNGGGKRIYRETGQGNGKYYFLLRMSDVELRSKFQLLCANCNCIKRCESPEKETVGVTLANRQKIKEHPQ